MTTGSGATAWEIRRLIRMLLGDEPRDFPTHYQLAILIEALELLAESREKPDSGENKRSSEESTESNVARFIPR
jgi:hypothetical protein